MRKVYTLATSLLFSSAALFAQQVTGIVKDGQGKLVSGSTVSLLRSQDSSVLKYSVTKEDGGFLFSNTKEGSYLVSASHVGHKTAYSPVFTVSGSNVEVPALDLGKATGDMKGVTVIATRPMVELKADKTILNVEGTINATGSDALELLRKSPGVLVDRDDNLSLSGKNGVQVYIDGRPTPLSGKDLSDYLKSLQSAQIDAIEIITNPSAKYEAAGNAGIINIRLKKNKSYGTNGSVNAGWNIGTFAKYNGGVSLNNRNKIMNVFGNYNYSRGLYANYMNMHREVLDTLFEQRSTMQLRGLNHNFKAGLDYFINPKSTIGIIVNGTYASPEFSNYSRTPISYLPTGIVDRILIADNSNTMQRHNTNFNINYRRADTSGRELNLDADYGTYSITSDQLQPNYYFDASGQNELRRVVYNMLAPTNIDLYSFKGDYEQSFKKGKLGIGGKLSYVTTDNDFQRYNVYTNIKLLDTLRSNRFDYTENINAGYVNYNRAFKSVMLQAGLRVENTTSEGRSTGFKQVGSNYTTYDSSFNRSYTDVFPSASITFTKNPKSQFGIAYSRRIDRPAYQDLNPFEFKLDEYTYMKGNTGLRPQYTTTIGITHTYHFKLNTKLNYSHVADVFSQLVDVDKTEPTKSFLTKENLATQDIISLNISYPLQYKSFSSFANVNAYYAHYQANNGPKREIDLDVYSFNVYMQNSLKFAKTWTAEVSGWYTSPSIWQGTFKSKQMGGVDVGLQKQAFNGKANIKASVSDVFKTMQWGSTSNYAGQYLRLNGGWESRQFKLSMAYRFGNAQVKAERQRKTGLDEESKRAQSSGGSLGQ